jgi:hypothetical protein
VFLFGVLLGLATAPAAHAAGKPAQIVGGNTVMSPEEAPWSVFITAVGAGGTTLCSGSIITPDRVLTAAHCVLDGTRSLPASAFSVVAGIVDGRLGADWTRIQTRQVGSTRVHPSYVTTLRGYDVAVLTLAQPFDVTGSAVRAIPLAAPSDVTGAVRVYGWGRSTATTRDDKLHSLNQSLVRMYRCANGAPAMRCGLTGSGATCFGDSGGGLIVPGPPARLIGVDSIGVDDGNVDCDLGERTGYIDITAPAIFQWLAGSNTPPLGPRATSRASMTPGDPLTCQSPSWTGSPEVWFDFIAVETGQLLQSGPATYKPTAADLGHPVTCVAVARNAGGMAETQAASPATMLDPMLSLDLAPNGTVTLSRAAPDAPLSRLAIYNSAGVAVSVTPVDLSQPVTMPKLPAGRYQVCVQSDPTPTYVAGSACDTWIVAGKAAELVSKASVKRWHGLWRVALRTSPGLVGKRVTLRWKIASCRTCKGRYKSVRRKLGATIRVNSPRVPRARVIRLTGTAPAVTYDGVPYAAGKRTFAIHR